jgi:hypothetical protein
MRVRDSGWKKHGFGIEDGKNSDPGSGIIIPDPQHYWSLFPIFFGKFDTDSDNT